MKIAMVSIVDINNHYNFHLLMINKINSRHHLSPLPLPSSLSLSLSGTPVSRYLSVREAEMLKWSVNNIPQCVVRESLNQTNSDRYRYLGV